MHDFTLRVVPQTQPYCVLGSFGNVVHILLFFEVSRGLPVCDKIYTHHPASLNSWQLWPAFSNHSSYVPGPTHILTLVNICAHHYPLGCITRSSLQLTNTPNDRSIAALRPSAPWFFLPDSAFLILKLS